MRISNSEHTFEHPWDTVVKAVWRKYPNPLNPNVVGIDIIDRAVCPKTAVLKTHRLISCNWGLPGWAEKILGKGVSYASEHSEVDPKTRTFTLKSKNVSFCNEISLVEQITYIPHPEDPNMTMMKQETLVEVHGMPLRSYFEDFVYKDIAKNALKGRQAMELVIGKINSEMHELTAKMSDELRTVQRLTTVHAAQDIKKQSSSRS